MIDTTFAVHSLDRSKIKWEKHIFDLSPVEKHGDIYFKREDKFAPLGYGGINGSKLRVCIWLINEAVQAGAKGVIHGAVTGSPQHIFVATICKHYGIPCVDVIGTQDIDGHEYLSIAREMGAKFEYSPIGYAKTLESKAFQLRESAYHDFFVLETNITVNEGRNSPARIQKFHNVGSYQSYNIPDHIETVILPAGSCNSSVGALYGIAQKRPKNLNHVILMGIGNYGSKDPDYIRRRLQLIGAPDVFEFPWIADADGLPFEDEGKIKVCHFDVYAKDYTTYNDLMPFNYHGIEMHPRYEGKIFNWMKDNNRLKDEWMMNDKAMFWIVGGGLR